jgi:hypothetical protein
MPYAKSLQSKKIWIAHRQTGAFWYNVSLRQKRFIIGHNPLAIRLGVHDFEMACERAIQVTQFFSSRIRGEPVIAGRNRATSARHFPLGG